MNPKLIGELSPPPIVLGGVRGTELLRVWIADKSQHVSLRSGVWDDPASWGVLLVDLARHVSRSHCQSTPNKAQFYEVMNRIKQGFDAEWQRPTDLGSGSIG